MTDVETADAHRLRLMVEAVMHGAADAEPTMLGGTAVDGALMLRAFQFITAAMFEAHPELATQRDLREATEMQAKQMQAFIRRFREDFERTGDHPWDLINAPAEVMN